MAKRKAASASAATRSLRYPEKRHRAKQSVIKWCNAASNQDVNKTDSIEFSFKSAANEYVRFPEEPFVLSYKCKHLNPAYEADSQDDSKKHKYHYLSASKGEHQVYLHPLLSVTSFFEGCSVQIDGKYVGVNKLAGLEHPFQVLNRTFMQDERYKEKYGKKRYRLTNMNQMKLNPKAEALLKAQLPLEFESRNDAKLILPRTERFSPGDSIFPFYNQSNLLHALTGKTVPRGFFQPETPFVFNLKKRVPIDQAVEQLLISDLNYFGGVVPIIAAATAAGKVGENANYVKDIILEIIDIKLSYESYTPESTSGIPRMSTFFCDVPQVLVTNLPPEQNVFKIDFAIPPGTKAAYIVYAYQEQLWLDQASKKNISNRFVFPKTLKRIDFELDGRQDILIKKGLVNPGKRDAAINESCLAYFNNLVSQKIYEGELEDLFSRSENPYNYEQSLVFDFTTYNIDREKGAVLTLNHEFGGAGHLSPVGVNILAFCISQYAYHVNNANKNDRVWREELIK